MLYGYRSNKSNALNQDIIKSVITFLKKSGRLDKPLINLNQWFYVLLFFFLPICLLCVFRFFFFWFLFLFLFFLLENKCKCAAYNWLQTSCINTLLLTNSSLILVLLFVTRYNLQTLNVLCSFIISVWLIMNTESFVFLYVFYLAFLMFHVCKFNIIIIMIIIIILIIIMTIKAIIIIIIIIKIIIIITIMMKIIKKCKH